MCACVDAYIYIYVICTYIYTHIQRESERDTKRERESESNGVDGVYPTLPKPPLKIYEAAVFLSSDVKGVGSHAP